MESSREKIQVIVVGGGGTMGSSTALHLIRNGYTPSNITVLDTYQIPSAQSAGNDLNKIMGIRLRNPVDIQLSLEARDMWRNDELFKPFFHNTGRDESAGSFKHPLFNDDGITCIGVETVDGTKYYADKVVLAAGAWSPALVDLEDQCCSKAWVYAHIQLTPEEATEYKDVPVVYNGDIGFFFEPNE
ncbi:hypothetical protein ACMFMF_011823 [Clarireedia jacksonii]